MTSAAQSARPHQLGAEFEGFDVIALPGRKFEVVRSLTEHTLYQVARKNRVLIVEPFQSVATLIRDAHRQKRSWKISYGLRQERENLWIYTPPPLGLPGHTRWKTTNDINSYLIAKQIKRIAHQLNFQDPLVWTFIYDTGRLQHHLHGRMTIYDCMDNYEALARDDRHRALVARYERETCEQSDIVFACTELLGSTRRRYNPNTIECYCAADTEFFARALDPATQVPDDIASLPQPVIGYVGGCDPYRINTALVQHVAETRPDWSIVFVGYMWFGFDQSALAKLPNVHFLGPKDYDLFPGYLKGMRVCMAPFNLNDLTKYGDALKIYEYLAAGRPVVSTTIPAACRVREVVRIADEADQFTQAIEAALADPPESVQRRLEVVQNHTWEKRVAQKWGHIRQFLVDHSQE